VLSKNIHEVDILLSNLTLFNLQPGIRWGKQLYKMGMGRKINWGKEPKFSYFLGMKFGLIHRQK
jgi:hypothetical protein